MAAVDGDRHRLWWWRRRRTLRRRQRFPFQPGADVGAFINWAKTFVKKQAAAERDMAD
jgi:hypothetical protein